MQTTTFYAFSTAFGLALLSFAYYRWNEGKIGPTPNSIVVITGAANNYGFLVTKEVARYGFTTLAIAHNLKEAEILRDTGYNKIDTLMEGNMLPGGIINSPTLSELSMKIKCYADYGLNVRGIVAVIIPKQYYNSTIDMGTPTPNRILKEMVEFDAMFDGIMPQLTLLNTLRLVFVYPSANEIEEKAWDFERFIRGGFIKFAENRNRVRALNSRLFVSVVLCPARNKPHEVRTNHDFAVT